MQNPIPRPLLDRNPITHQRHRHEVFWQITIPLLVGLGIFAIIFIFVVSAENSADVSQQADVAAIWLVAINCLVFILILPLLVIITYLVIRATSSLPIFFKRGQDFVFRVQTFVSHANDRLVAPIIGINEKSASMRALKNKLFRRKSSPW